MWGEQSSRVHSRAHENTQLLELLSALSPGREPGGAPVSLLLFGDRSRPNVVALSQAIWVPGHFPPTRNRFVLKWSMRSVSSVEAFV